MNSCLASFESFLRNSSYLNERDTGAIQSMDTFNHMNPSLTNKRTDIFCAKILIRLIRISFTRMRQPSWDMTRCSLQLHSGMPWKQMKCLPLFHLDLLLGIMNNIFWSLCWQWIRFCVDWWKSAERFVKNEIALYYGWCVIECEWTIPQICAVMCCSCCMWRILKNWEGGRES